MKRGQSPCTLSKSQWITLLGYWLPVGQWTKDFHILTRCLKFMAFSLPLNTMAVGRAGRIAEAEELIRKMRMKPDRFVLGGIIAKRAAKQLLELDPDDEGTYVLLSYLYSSMGKWEEAKRIWKLIAERNINKPHKCSVIEVDGIVHEFVKGDSSHPQTANIYEMLEDMIGRLKKAGYVPQKAKVFLDMDEEEKETALCLHSEKLAFTFWEGCLLGEMTNEMKTTELDVLNNSVTLHDAGLQPIDFILESLRHTFN
ncbi:hypothetical protein ACLB2K_063103 [Fragaria x ananassa]